jgi:hypothetical protein
MSLAERSSLARFSFRVSSPSKKNILIAMLLAAFFALHVLAGAIVQSATSMGPAPPQEEAGASSYD